MDYEPSGYRPADLVRMDILSTASRSMPSRRSSTGTKPTACGRASCEQLREVIPRHLFDVAIQAAIGGRDHRPRERSRPCRKNVTAKCYGGDITGSGSCWRSRRKARSG